jgi:WD40 repeat protein
VTASVIAARTRYRASDEQADKNAHVWNVKSQKFDRELKGHKEPVTKVIFSSSGAYVATLSTRQLQLWDTSTWKSIPFTNDSSLLDAAFSPDEQVLYMIHADGRLATTSLKKVETKFIKLAPSLNRAVFNLQANRVAAVVSDDMLRVWDMDGIRKSTVKASYTVNVAFSPDSALLFTAGLDTRIYVWKTETGEAVTETGQFDFPLTSLAFDPRLSSLLIGDSLGKVHVIECELCRPFDQIKKMAIESHPRKLTPAEVREYLPDEKP